MRIIGEIEHPKYKITVLHMNAKVTIQIEDRLVTQSFTFRDGSGIRDLNTAREVLSDDFLSSVDSRFEAMNKDYMKALENMSRDDFEDFDII